MLMGVARAQPTAQGLLHASRSLCGRSMPHATTSITGASCATARLSARVPAGFCGGAGRKRAGGRRG
eukprot:1616191-Pleurochrysis_carterae.AAC.5